ncbi:hypothetical protein NHX12_031365 [Muraenolepis orangiensis]|uniref:Protein FAM104A-like n=1 Tax=Muraenolepis orangiensis TaxID=630683 RepID=A0A9Q0E7R5_9TELE|nr:hypothetical protein NHX12_031365 [Muraenolepis orangiensis]
MLTENRKRQRSGEDQEGQLVPQAKRPSRAHPLSPEPGRDAGDAESSNSESSGISSPDHLVGSCSGQFNQDTLARHRVPVSCSPLASFVDSSNSSSSSSSELTAPTSLLSYHQINRILREAHFYSLHSQGLHTDT